MVIFCGAELFTGNNLLTTALLAKKIIYKNLINNWLLVYAGNFIGSMIIAALIVYSGLLSTNNGKLGELAVKIALNKTNLSLSAALIRGVLCNMLVVLAVWMATAAQDAAGKILTSWFSIMLFVLSGYEHCVANMYFIPVGIMLQKHGAASGALLLTWKDFGLNNLLPVTFGNIIGGGIIIGACYWYICNQKSAYRNDSRQTYQQVELKRGIIDIQSKYKNEKIFHYLKRRE